MADPRTMPHDALRVRSGDTLLVTLDADQTLETIEDIAAALKRELPHVKVVVITGAQQVVSIPGPRRPLAAARRARRLARG